MKKLLIIAFLVTFLFSCKKGDTKTYEIKIEGTGTNYDLFATVSVEGGNGRELLNKTSLSGTTTYLINPLVSENINVRYVARANINIKIYVDGKLRNNENRTPGNGIFSIRK